jgi:8-oxo-dGTP pyrophosphatase MutT (NUDIX family)
MGKKKRIRPLAVCVFRNGNRIMLEESYDPTKDEVFYRPPGGGIHFGETSADALCREMEEEIGVVPKNPTVLGVLENLFVFDGEPGHEIVFVYDAEMPDPALYEQEEFRGYESDGEPIRAFWQDLNEIGPDTPPIYPDDLLNLLDETGNRSGTD